MRAGPARRRRRRSPLRWRAAGLLGVAACSGGTGPQTQCTGEASACLTGTASVQGFTASPSELQLSLFREFPSAGATPLSTTIVPPGAVYTFSQLDPWSHYYIIVQADFGQEVPPAAFVGPLTVPVTGPVDVTLDPVELSVLEQSSSATSMQLHSAVAYLFDPASGAPVQGATVTIAVGGTTVPMTWATIPASTTDTYGYVATFASPTPAQPTYTITTAAPGASPASWQLVAAPPTFTPLLSSPADDSQVPANQALTVSWPEEPTADEELVLLYAQKNGAWSTVFQAPPADEDVLEATIPAGDVAPAGQPLLVNVAFLKGSCPATAAGCVVAEAVAAAQITPQ